MKRDGKSVNERWIRDLRWVLDSPYLMSPVLSDERGFFVIPAMEKSELCEQELELFTERYSGHRVGYYFENLIYFWLKHVRRVEILAHSFQIMEEGRTLGELDFVFRDERGQVNHWEVAAKFYLYCGDRKVKGSHFIGPNRQDTFELKRDKIFGKQLPLSEMTFPEVSFRQAFVKGRIFHHPEAMLPEELPQGMRADHLRGIWIRHSELSWLERKMGAAATSYHLIKKPYWLAAECFSVSEPSLLTFRELIEHLGVHFSERKHPILISVLVQEGSWWQECDRIFVVADDWSEA